MAVGDPDKGIAPKHLDIPPLIVDMDAGYGNIFNVQRTTELYVNAGVAAAHIEDQVLPKRCGHIGGKALVPGDEMVGKLRMARAVADDLGNEDFVIIARTDGLSAVDAPESQRAAWSWRSIGRCATSTRASRTWCGASSLRPIGGRWRTSPSRCASAFPDARFAFNWSSSFKWFKRPGPDHLRRPRASWASSSSSSPSVASTRWATASASCWQAMADRQEQGYIELQRREWEAGKDIPTRSHHQFSGVPYHHLVGHEVRLGAAGP